MPHLVDLPLEFEVPEQAPGEIMPIGLYIEAI